MAKPNTGYIIQTAAQLRAIPLATRYGGEPGFSLLALDRNSWYTYQHGLSVVDDGDELLSCDDGLGSWVKHARRLGSPSKASLGLTTPSIAAGEHLTISLPLGNTLALLKLTSSSAVRIRLYTTSAKREADRDRKVGASPVTTANDHGVLLDEVLGTTNMPLQVWLAPAVIVYSTQGDGMVPALITNLSGEATALTLALLRTILEL